MSKNISLEELQQQYPLWGAYVCLATYLKGKSNVSETVIRRLLKRFVPKDDYERKDTDKLVQHLLTQTIK